MFALALNDMRQPNIENIEVVKVVETRQELEDYYSEHLAKKPWTDGSWWKVFKKDSPLEWFNPVFDLDEIGVFGEGIQALPEDMSEQQALRLRKTKHTSWHLIPSDKKVS